MTAYIGNTIAVVIKTSTAVEKSNRLLIKGIMVNAVIAPSTL